MALLLTQAIKAKVYDKQDLIALKATSQTDRQEGITSPPLEEEPLLLLEDPPLLELEAEVEDELGDELDEVEEDDELPSIEDA